MKHVTELRLLSDHRVWVRFDDGVAGEVDLDDIVTFEGVFAPFRDEARFAELAIHPELGTVTWPDGADIDSEVLYAFVTGEPIVIGGDVVFQPPVRTGR